jgi:hypothetical protein
MLVIVLQKMGLQSEPSVVHVGASRNLCGEFLKSIGSMVRD